MGHMSNQENDQNGLKRPFGAVQLYEEKSSTSPKKVKQDPLLFDFLLEEEKSQESHEELEMLLYMFGLSEETPCPVDEETKLEITPNKGDQKKKGKGPTSMSIFLDFTKRDSETQQVDPSGIISRDCYTRWLDTRRSKPIRPEETFRKAILCHLTCTDGGSQPFPEEVEAALLTMLREGGKVWPCFKGSKYERTGETVKIGIKGLRCKGYHERKKEGQE
jgi:hypothetical protein